MCHLYMLLRWCLLIHWLGEFRVHYAGFFDPGFGHAKAGGKGARGVLGSAKSRSAIYP